MNSFASLVVLSMEFSRCAMNSWRLNTSSDEQSRLLLHRCWWATKARVVRCMRQVRSGKVIHVLLNLFGLHENEGRWNCSSTCNQWKGYCSQIIVSDESSRRVLFTFRSCQIDFHMRLLFSRRCDKYRARLGAFDLIRRVDEILAQMCSLCLTTSKSIGEFMSIEGNRCVCHAKGLLSQTFTTNDENDGEASVSRLDTSSLLPARRFIRRRQRRLSS